MTLGIIGTALGAWALFGNNRRSTGLLGTTGGGGMLGDGSTNINVVGAGIGSGTAAPSAVDFWFEDDDFDGNKVWKYFNEM